MLAIHERFAVDELTCTYQSRSLAMTQWYRSCTIRVRVECIFYWLW